jgi:hypothetical protein
LRDRHIQPCTTTSACMVPAGSRVFPPNPPASAYRLRRTARSSPRQAILPGADVTTMDHQVAEGSRAHEVSRDDGSHLTTGGDTASSGADVCCSILQPTQVHLHGQSCFFAKSAAEDVRFSAIVCSAEPERASTHCGEGSDEVRHARDEGDLSVQERSAKVRGHVPARARTDVVPFTGEESGRKPSARLGQVEDAASVLVTACRGLGTAACAPAALVPDKSGLTRRTWLPPSGAVAAVGRRQRTYPGQASFGNRPARSARRLGVGRPRISVDRLGRRHRGRTATPAPAHHPPCAFPRHVGGDPVASVCAIRADRRSRRTRG